MAYSPGRHESRPLPLTQLTELFAGEAGAAADGISGVRPALGSEVAAPRLKGGGGASQKHDWTFIAWPAAFLPRRRFLAGFARRAGVALAGDIINNPGLDWRVTELPRGAGRTLYRGVVFNDDQRTRQAEAPVNRARSAVLDLADEAPVRWRARAQRRARAIDAEIGEGDPQHRQRHQQHRGLPFRTIVQILSPT